MLSIVTVGSGRLVVLIRVVVVSGLFVVEVCHDREVVFCVVVLVSSVVGGQ